MTRRLVRHGVCLACALALAACAARLPARPAGPETSDPSAIDAFTAATKQCVGLKTQTAELRLRGRMAGERLGGRLIAGFETPASLRIEAMAPFGQPVFILAGRDNRATLLLPREERVLRDATVAAVLERLTGLALSAADLRLILTGCLSVPATPSNGRSFAKGWQAVSLDSGVVAYLRMVNRSPVVVAADHGSWHVDYANHQGGWPRQVRIRSMAGDIDITAELGELEINTDIDPRAFEVAVPRDAAPMTLDHLRSVMPLRATQ